MTNENVLGVNISKQMDALGMNQRTLAEKIGVTEVSVSRYINGERIPKAPILIKIAKELKTTPTELMGETLNGDARVMFNNAKLIIKTFASQWTRAEKVILFFELLGWNDEGELATKGNDDN